MKTLITTLFILGMIAVTTQTIRHGYVRCYYDRPSVLDKYNDDETDEQIKGSISLDSLLFHFDKAFNDVVAFEVNKSEEELKSVKKYSDEPYISKTKYKIAIEDWEKKEEKIIELIVFWFVGLILIIAGCFLFYKKYKWLGLGFIIPGMIQMIWWSSPSLSTTGSHVEFLKYLNIKLCFSVLTLLLIIGMWLFFNRNEKKGQKSI